MKMISARPQDVQTVSTNLKRLNLSKLETSFTCESPRDRCSIPLILSSNGTLIRQAHQFLSDRAYYGSGWDQSNTVRTYAECVYHWLQYLEGIGRDWQQATSRDLVRYRNSMKDRVSAQTKRQLKSSTINLRLTVVVEFYRYLDDQTSIAQTPSVGKTSFATSVKQGKQNYKLRKSLSRPRAMTQEICARLMSALSGVHRIIFAWSLATGVRTSSILSITIQNYSLISVGGEDFIELMMKGGRMQKVYVPHSLRADTDRYLSSTRILNSKVGFRQNIYNPNLFINIKGEVVSRNCYYAAFQRACKSLGIKAHPHQARTTFATFIERKLSAAGLNLGFDHVKIIQGLLGHTSASTTQQYLEDISGNNVDVLGLIDSYADALSSI